MLDKVRQKTVQCYSSHRVKPSTSDHYASKESPMTKEEVAIDENPG